VGGDNLKKSIIRKTLEAAIEYPCAICGAKAEAVGSFTPSNPEKFGAGPDEAIYYPVCLNCMADQIDTDFLEQTFLHCGITKRA